MIYACGLVAYILSWLWAFIFAWSHQGFIASIEISVFYAVVLGAVSIILYIYNDPQYHVLVGLMLPVIGVFLTSAAMQDIRHLNSSPAQTGATGSSATIDSESASRELPPSTSRSEPRVASDITLPSNLGPDADDAKRHIAEDQEAIKTYLQAHAELDPVAALCHFLHEHPDRYPAWKDTIPDGNLANSEASH